MGKNLKVLMISSDRNVILSDSGVTARIREYGALVSEIHIVLLSDARHEFKDIQIAENVWVYPTNSFSNFMRPIDAAHLGKKIIFDKKFVRGGSLITADSLECGWAGLRVKNKWRIPLELQIHTDIFSPYFTGFQNKVRKFFAKKIIYGSDGIRVVSEELKSKILGVRPDANVFVLPIYVDREKIENASIKLDVRARYGWSFAILSVSRLSPEKNLSLALETLSLVRQRFPDTGLIIVGSGQEEGYLKSLAKKLNLSGAVEFAGWQEELASFYKTSNAFIQTSFFEGYGLSLVEAGLSGLPILTTSVGVAREFQDGRDLFICDSKESFTTRIIELIESNSKRESLRFNMKKALEGKLVSKEEYLNGLVSNWQKISAHIG